MAQSSEERILYQLKSGGEQSAATLGRALAVTAVGARQHLERLAAQGLVQAAFHPAPRGRPRKLWRLTARGHARFPDRHADLTLELIRATEALFGAAGLEALIARREQQARARYRAATAARRTLRGKVQALARLREAEGYMASMSAPEPGVFLLIEDHCPICAAARLCQGFCRSELALFQDALGAGVAVERVDHLLAGARRCAYRIAARGDERA